MNETVETIDEGPADTGKELTGRTVLFIILASFGVIISVNMVLMFSAIGTFPGLEVKNSYVASQEFNQLAGDQRALGWDPVADYDGETITFSITDEAGQAVSPAMLNIRLGRPTHGEADQILTLENVDGTYQTAMDLDFGAWRLFVDGEADNGTKFTYRMEIYVPKAD